MEGIVCKFRVNIPCRLFIGEDLYVDADGNEVVLQPGKSPNKLLLNEGEDYYRFVSVEDENILYEADITVDNEFAKPIHTIDLAPTTDTTKTETTSEQKQEFKKYDIFISYRKKSSSQRVDKLYHYLNGKYPDKVFRDIKELAVGDWLTQIVQYVDTCKMLVVVLDSDTFKDRDISNDTKELYERWATLSREELHAEIERLPLNEKEKVNYIRIEILRAKAHNVTIFPIKCGIGELSEDLKNALYCKEQFEVSPTVTDDEWLTLVKDKWESSVVSELYAVQYSKQGKDILATDIYYDSNRAKKEFGFDGAFYIPRKVDDELSMYVENPKFPFCFITGLPGSGKTRAIYQLCHGALKNQSVIILTKSNVNTIADLLSSNTRKIDSQYIICDQIIDVLFVLDEEKRKTFIDKLCDSNYYHLIGSNTKARLEDFLYEYDDYLTSNQYKRIETPIIDDTIIKRLRNKYKNKKSKNSGKTIADFIPGISKYQRGIIEKVIQNVNDSFLEAWLKSLQLVMTFRKEYPLFLAILVMLKIEKSERNQQYEDELLKCIKAMLNHNMLYIQYRGSAITSEAIDDNFIDLNSEEDYEYDGESFPRGKIIGQYKKGEDYISIEQKDCIFEVNELVWQYLIEKGVKQKSSSSPKKITYNLAADKDLNNAIQTYYNTFPTLSSLRRIVPRIPYDSVQEAANKKVIGILEKEYINEEVGGAKDSADLEEIQLVYSLIIGRCKNEEDVNKYLEKLVEKNIIQEHDYPGNIIGELYRFAENKFNVYSAESREYIHSIRKSKRSYILLDKNKRIVFNEPALKLLGNLKIEDLYAISKEIRALLSLKEINLDYSSLQQYLEKCFDLLELKNIEDPLKENPLLSSSADDLLGLLVRCSNAETENIQAIRNLLDTYNLQDKESKIYPRFTIFKYMAKYADGNPEKCRCIIDQLIYSGGGSCTNESWNLIGASEKAREFFGQFIVSAIAQVDTFVEAVQLYELYAKGFEKKSVTEFTEEHADKYKILGMAMRKCIVSEFQTMAQYVDKILQPLRTQLGTCKELDKKWHINYTIKVLTDLLMEKAPSHTDAMYYVEHLDVEQIDSYALFHVLKKVLKNSNRNEQFLWAYNAINHPKLKPHRTEGQILNLLYQSTNDLEQEILIDEIAGEEWKGNCSYLSVKIGKSFRSLSQKWELYESFYIKNDSDEGSENIRYVDLFSTLTKELWKAKNQCDKLNADYEKSPENSEKRACLGIERNTLQNEIEKIESNLKEEQKKDFIDKDIDPYYTMALIQLGSLIVFDENNEITNEFKDTHVQKFTNVQLWNKLINYFYIKNDRCANEKTKALCQLYKEIYERTKRSYKLYPDTIMRRNLKKAGLSLDVTDDVLDLDAEGDISNDEMILNETTVENSVENYLDDNDYIFTENEKESVQLNDHFGRLKKCEEAKNIIWWTKKINWLKKQINDSNKDTKCECLYNAYLIFLKGNLKEKALHPDWMMYKYSYDKPLDECIRDLFDGKKHIMRELENPTIIPSRLADVFEHICKLQKAKKDVPTIEEIIKVIDSNNLWEMIDIDHKSLVSLYLFIIRQGAVGQKYLSEYKNKFEQINKSTKSNLKPLGELSREMIVMTNNSLRHSFYFYKWLKEYLDIYKSEEKFCERSANDSTIKIHIQRHLEFDCYFEEYVNAHEEYKSLNEEIKKKIDLKEKEILKKDTLQLMLKCYKNYTIENLNNIYDELTEELRRKGGLGTLDNNVSVDNIVENLDKYAALKDDIVTHYESNSNFKRAAVLGSDIAQYKYGVANNIYNMIISAAKHGNEDALMHLRSTFKNDLQHCNNNWERKKLCNDFINNGFELDKNDLDQLDKNDLFELGKAYFYLCDGEKCVESYHLASEKGHAQAAHFLYEMYNKGRLVGVDKHKAWYYLKLSVLNNTNLEDTRDKDMFVQLSLDNVKKLENTSLATIIDIYNGLVEVGYKFTKEDYYKLGYMYKSINDTRCVNHYEDAAKLGSATAAYDLWKMYESGIVVEKSLEQARYWMNLAAKLGHIFATQNAREFENANALYIQGDELMKNKDEKKGEAILIEAANMGSAEAQNRLGALYIYRANQCSKYDIAKIEKNNKDAYNYFMLAADQGFAIAQYHVGYCMENGRGIEKNLVEAKKWYQKAAEQGFEKAIEKLKKI